MFGLLATNLTLATQASPGAKEVSLKPSCQCGGELPMSTGHLYLERRWMSMNQSSSKLLTMDHLSQHSVKQDEHLLGGEGLWQQLSDS